MVNDRTGVLDLEATGGVGVRNVEQDGTPAPLLPLEQQILQEAEVTTPPRVGGSSRARGTSGSRTSITTRRGMSSASDFYGRPIKGHRFGPTE